MELWDLYDANRTFLNKKIIRGQKPPANTYHLVVGLWIINQDGALLTTLRAPQKETYPNLWENTGGCVKSGESSLEGALRELQEETGIETSPHTLHLLKSHVERTAIVDQYMLMKDVPISALRLQAEETTAAKWVSISTFLKMIQDGCVADPVVRRFQKIFSLLKEKTLAASAANANESKLIRKWNKMKE